jgi:hypothetical protein
VLGHFYACIFFLCISFLILAAPRRAATTVDGQERPVLGYKHLFKQLTTRIVMQP